MDYTYSPPTALTALSGIFLILGAICAVVITVDIVLRKGWRSMMWIMIPVYIINATYMLPVTLYVYFKYGRPSPPEPGQASGQSPPAIPACHQKSPGNGQPQHRTDSACASNITTERRKATNGGCASVSDNTSHADPPTLPQPCHSAGAEPRDDFSASSDAEKADAAVAKDTRMHCHHHGNERPMLATVLVGVSHCGAGCVLGDLVGEWLVYGTNARINGEMIWVELLVDYAFALLFGIVFQYFSIAPMSGEYGPKTVWRAAKADILSLTSFEVGAFGGMLIFQVGAFDYRLSMATWTYWWMMQISMAFGFATAMPVNWWLIRKGIKEPCA